MKKTSHTKKHKFNKKKHEKHITFTIEGKRIRYLPFWLPTTPMQEGEVFVERELESVEEPYLIKYSAKQCTVCNIIYGLEVMHNEG